MVIKQLITSGVRWNSLSQFGRQVIQFITSVILARILLPSDFGLLSMAIVVVGFVSLFRDMGTSSAAIQRKEVSEKLLSSIFWVNIVLGVIATILVFVSSSFVAYLYREPEVGPILRILSLTFLFSAFSVVHNALYEKNMTFNKLAKLEIIAILTGSLVAVISALSGAGVWSLVCQNLITTLVLTLLLWLTSKWRPKFIFSWQEIRSISAYSLNLTGFNVLNYFSRNADYVLIGRFLGSQNLGYYTLAYRIMLYPIQNVSDVMGRLLLPIFSKIQDNNKAFLTIHLYIINTIAFVTFPIMLGLWCLADFMVPFAFGSKWIPIIPLLLILTPVGMLQSIITTVGAIYQAKGRTRLMLYWGIVSGMLAILAFIIGLHWGLIGIAAAYAILTILLAYPNFAIPYHVIDFSVVNIWYAIKKPLLNSIIMVVVILGIRFLITPCSFYWFFLGFFILIGFIVYVLMNWINNREQLLDFLKLINLKR
jgi:O-antigen/teichoic acid export membrane protein